MSITSIAAPELKSVMGEEVLTFKLDYESYKSKVNDINSTRSDDQKIPPAGMKSCIQPELLQSMVLCSVFKDSTDVNNVSNTDVEQWVDSRCRVSTSELDRQVKDALSRVSFKPRKGDPEGATLRFFTSVMTELARNRASSVLTDSPKALIEQLVPKLEPRLLQDRMSSKMDFWSDEDKKNFKAFMKSVKTTYVEVASFTDDVRSDKQPTDKSKDIQQNNHAGKSNKSNATVSNLATDKSNDGTTGVQIAKKNQRSVEWTSKCLNPKCDQIHRIADCSITSEEDKKKLLDEYYNSRKRARLSSMHGKYTSDGRWDAC